MHAIEDGFPTVLVVMSGVITLTKAGDLWLSPINGVIATMLFLGIGLLLRSIRIKKEHGKQLVLKNRLQFKNFISNGICQKFQGNIKERLTFEIFH